MKITKAQLKQIIKEELEDYEDYDEDNPPEHEVIADKYLTSLYSNVANQLKLPTAQEDRQGIMSLVELETEDEFLDAIIPLAQSEARGDSPDWMPTIRSLTDKGLNIALGEIDKQKRNPEFSTMHEKKKPPKDGIPFDKLKKGRCTPMGTSECPEGSPQYNLAKAFKGKIRQSNLKRGKNPHGPG